MPFDLARIRELRLEVHADAAVLQFESLVAAFGNACAAQPAANEALIGDGLMLGMANANAPITRASLVAALLEELAGVLLGIDPAAPPPYLAAIIDGPVNPMPPAPALPGAHAPPQLPQADILELARINALRTADSRHHGLRMLDSARRLLGWFNWQPSDTTPARMFSARGVARRKAGKLFQPLSAAPHPDTGVWARNDFQALLQGGVPLLRNAHLNCWEFILVCAWDADVLSLHRLRRMHMQAQILARGGLLPATEPAQITEAYDDGAIRRYRAALESQLGATTAARIGAGAGSPLVPRAGDLVFVEAHGSRIGHVCISEGRIWNAQHGRFDQQVISIGHVDGDQVERVGLRAMALGGLNRFFRPCPF